MSGVEVVELSADEWARLKRTHHDPTDPSACTCGHEGLAPVWHLPTCPITA